MTDEQPDRVLCVVVCGAGPASEVDKLIRLAQDAGWEVNVVATPAALPFLDVPALEALTGHPVRSEYRSIGEPRARTAGVARAVIVAPATYNTINKLAAGISDNYALGVLAEAIGLGTPVVVLPFVNASLADRRPFKTAVAWLREEGVRVLFGREDWMPHPPGTGDHFIPKFPWLSALDAVSQH